MGREEFSSFFNENIGKVFRFVYLRVDSAETAQDISSLVFLKFWQKLSLRGVRQLADDAAISNPTAYLFKIARNALTDYYRQRGRRIVSLESLKEFGFDFPSADFSGKIEITFEMERIKKALQNVKPVYADVIIWHYVDDLPIKEIAGILEKREGTVRILLHRALKALREQLNP